MKNSITESQKNLENEEIKKQVEIKFQNIKNNFEERFDRHKKVNILIDVLGSSWCSRILQIRLERQS